MIDQFSLALGRRASRRAPGHTQTHTDTFTYGNDIILSIKKPPADGLRPVKRNSQPAIQPVGYNQPIFVHDVTVSNCEYL